MISLGMEAESVEMAKLAEVKKLAGKSWLSLSVKGSCSSSYEQEEEEKSMGGLKRGREEGSSGVGNSLAFRNWERSSEVTSRSLDIKCLSPLIPGPPSPCFDQETKKLIEKVMQKHCSDSPRVGEGSFKKSKVISAPVLTENSALRVTHSLSSQQEEKSLAREFNHKKTEPKVDDMLGAKPCSKSKVCRLPYTKWPCTAERGWLETGFRMGVTRPELYLSKRATQSDANPNQHRFQLTKADILNALQPMQALAAEAENVPVAVKVLDRKGGKYDMVLKYLKTSDTCRFMGPDYTKFLISSKLKPGQVMCIWGLPRDNSGNVGQHWLAFINSDEDDEGIGCCLSEGVGSLELPVLLSWKLNL